MFASLRAGVGNLRPVDLLRAARDASPRLALSAARKPLPCVLVYVYLCFGVFRCNSVLRFSLGGVRPAHSPDGGPAARGQRKVPDPCFNGTCYAAVDVSAYRGTEICCSV